jgi:plasmid rolling circle replication initiator protein Rep
MILENMEQALELITGTGEILEDYSATGKKRKWAEYKIDNGKIYNIYARIIDEIDENIMSESRLESIYTCADDLFFVVDKDKNKNLDQVNFCKDRFCPMCAKRKSLKIFGQVSEITEKMLAENNVEFVFLTLTIRNVTGEELSKTVTKLNNGFLKLVSKSKKFPAAERLKKNLLGALKVMEVTYNEEADTYHPHIHAILAVKPSYFARDYMTKAELIATWRKALKVDYDPSIDIRRIDRRPNAIAETAKYPVKMSNILGLDQDRSVEVVYVLKRALTGRRMIAFYGLFKTLKAQLGLDDIEDGDLIHVDEDKPLNAVARILYSWHPDIGNYIC